MTPTLGLPGGSPLFPDLSQSERLLLFCSRYIPFTLLISAFVYGGAGGFGKGFASRHAGIEPTWAD
ncbi:MAG: hypothetical protein CVV06_14360 [Gammaproteobacteria bacterium HGW-Gammaproteobacteria-10]|nr:MAG: hypothetical protein CVV06_14360 [Gammaproteobacteria bacterium HGW-Gammaproteobacteria-10]